MTDTPHYQATAAAIAADHQIPWSTRLRLTAAVKTATGEPPPPTAPATTRILHHLMEATEAAAAAAGQPGIPPVSQMLNLVAAHLVRNPDLQHA